MKSNHFQLILLCISLIAITFSCEKADIQKSPVFDDKKITKRWVDECEDCPNVDDCCCLITLVSGSTILFETCGTTDGDAAACTDEIDGCTTIDGRRNTNASLTLNQSKFFCMAENQSFYISASSTSGSTVNVTCQYGQVGAQSINLVFNGPGKKAISVNGECEVEQCYP